MIKIKIIPCEPTDPPKVYGGEDLRALLRGNSEFRVMWIGGVRYEMPREEPPASGMRIKLPPKETP